jgi:hypothetical protein
MKDLRDDDCEHDERDGGSRAAPYRARLRQKIPMLWRLRDA